MTLLQDNVTRVQEQIAAAARRAGRDPAEITLVAVSKVQPIEAIRAAYALGLRHFGENRVHEAQAKVRELPGDIVWHMIGHIQSRKAGDVVSLFHLVHAVDSLKLAQRLDRQQAELAGPDRRLPILIQCNVSAESSKYGLAADRWAEDKAQREIFMAVIRDIVALPHVQVQGLMTMAPIVADPEDARPFFARLRALRDELAGALPGASWSQLSMGMTDDFEIAVEEGATLVRVGRAIFAPDSPSWCELPNLSVTEA